MWVYHGGVTPLILNSDFKHRLLFFCGGSSIGTHSQAAGRVSEPMWAISRKKWRSPKTGHFVLIPALSCKKFNNNFIWLDVFRLKSVPVVSDIAVILFGSVVVLTQNSNFWILQLLRLPGIQTLFLRFHLVAQSLYQLSYLIHVC